MDWKHWVWFVLLIVLPSCGEKDRTEDKAKQAVKEAVTREFQYYEGAKQKLGEAEKNLQERKKQEEELN